MARTGTGTRTVTRDTLGAWLVKARPDPGSHVMSLLEAGGGTVTSRCVSRGYRSQMMAEGDTVLLWISGDGRRVARGVWGVGRVVGPVDDGEVAVDLPLLAEPVTVADLLAAGVDDLEVQRMPQGSNPSWVTREQLAVIESLLAG